jgi:uncharacterized membrane protein
VANHLNVGLAIHSDVFINTEPGGKKIKIKEMTHRTNSGGQSGGFWSIHVTIRECGVHSELGEELDGDVGRVRLHLAVDLELGDVGLLDDTLEELRCGAVGEWRDVRRWVGVGKEKMDVGLSPRRT